MTSNRTQLIARLSILCALTVVLGYYTKLPTPTGIVTLLDLGVYFTAFYFGRKEGAPVLWRSLDGQVEVARWSVYGGGR